MRPRILRVANLEVEALDNIDCLEQDKRRFRGRAKLLKPSSW